MRWKRPNPITKVKIAPTIPAGPATLYRCGRDIALRFVTLVCLIPVPMTAWLMSLASKDEWRGSPLGADLWWLIPALLWLLTAVLPLAILLLHDRYVMQLDRTDHGTWRLKTFLVWGSRTRDLPDDIFAGARASYQKGRFESWWTPSVDAPYWLVRTATGKWLIFDAYAEVPHGHEVLSLALGYDWLDRPDDS